MALSSEDVAILAGVSGKAAIMRTRIESVCKQFTCGAFIFGPGGHGKSHHIKSELTKRAGKENRDWIYFNSDISGPALFQQLENHPDKIHFLEDCEHILKNAKIQGGLRSALNGTPGKKRTVTYTNMKVTMRFDFAGGIVIASNEQIASGGTLGAVASRVGQFEWKLNPVELSATMRQIALAGYKHNGIKVTPNECSEVAEFLINEMEQLHDKTCVTLRTFVDQALPSYVQWREGDGEVGWEDIVRTYVTQAIPEKPVKSRAERTAEEREIAVQIWIKYPTRAERVKEWERVTGKSQTQLYDHAKKAGLTDKVFGQLMMVTHDEIKKPR